MEYYALHYLNCSDTYDPERGVVQLAQIVKVYTCIVYNEKQNAKTIIITERGWSH